MIKINENEDFEWFIDMLDKDKSYYKDSISMNSKQFEKNYYLSIKRKYDVKVSVIYYYSILESQRFGCTLSVKDNKPQGDNPEFMDKLIELKDLITKGFIKRMERKLRVRVDMQDLLGFESPSRFFYSLTINRDNSEAIKFIYSFMEKELPKFLKSIELKLKRGKGRM